MTPRPPLLETAEASGAVEVWAMPARRMGWGMERRVVRGVVRVGVGVGEDIVGRDGGFEYEMEGGRGLYGTIGEVLLVVRGDELESSMLFCCSESARSGNKMWGAEVSQTEWG